MSDPISVTLQNIPLSDLAESFPLSQLTKFYSKSYSIALAERGKLLHCACYDKTNLGQEPFIKEAWEKAGLPYVEKGPVSHEVGLAILKRAVALLKNYPLQKLCKFLEQPLSPEESTALQRSNSDTPTPPIVKPELLQRLKSLHHKLALDIADDPNRFLKFFEFDRQEFIEMFFPFTYDAFPHEEEGQKNPKSYSMAEKIESIFSDMELYDGTADCDFFILCSKWSELREASPLRPLLQTIEYLPEFFVRAMNKDITCLDLSDISFSLNLPFSISSLRHLEKLSIAEEHFTSAWKWLPGTLGELHELKELSVQGCDIRELPHEIGSLQKITRLVCADTLLSTLPSEISQLVNLKKLLIWKNKIETIPEEFFKNLTNLKELDAAINLLSVVPSSIGQLVNLEILKLDKNRIEQIREECFENLPNLRELVLSQNPLKSLPESLRGSTKLETLDVSETNLEPTPQLLKLISDLRATGCEVQCDPAIDSEIGRVEELSFFE